MGPSGPLRRRALCLAAGLAAAALQWASGRGGGSAGAAGFAQGAPRERPARALLSARRAANKYMEGRAEFEELREEEQRFKDGDKVMGKKARTGKWRGKKWMPLGRYKEMMKKNSQMRYLSRWTDPSPARGETGRGKQNHFHLLDRYIRSIDSLVPEDMENLVKPLDWEANMAQTTKTIKFLLGPNAKHVNNSVIEEDIRHVIWPNQPLQVVTWTGWRERPAHSPRPLPPRGPTPSGRLEDTGEVHEAYAFFESNEECQDAWQKARAGHNAGQLVAGDPVEARYTVNKKWFKVCAEVGVEAAGDMEIDGGFSPARPDDGEFEDDGPGTYRVISAAPLRTLRVRKDCDRTSEIVGELPMKQEVRVLELSAELIDGRRRARIEDPAGWITVLNTNNDFRFAMKQPETQVGAGGRREPPGGWHWPRYYPQR